MNRTRHLFRSGLIVIALLGLDKLVGFGRTLLVSSAFGTSSDFDAFTAANQLPEVFVTLISGGALAAAFVPVYSAHLGGEKSRESARLASAIITLVLLLLGIISAVGAVFAPWIMRELLVPGSPIANQGFSPEMQALAAELMRIILIQTTIFGVSGVLSSILNAHQHFALPALAPSALHVGYIIGLYFFVPRWGIHGLAWGTVIGGLLHVLVQTPGLIRYGFHYKPALGLQMAGVMEILRLMGPRIVTLGTVQIADLFIIRLASRLDTGVMSGYFYGYYLQQLPETLFGTAIAIAVFPTMAELFNAGDIAGVKQTAVSALRVIWSLTVPAAAGLVLLGQPAISLFLERGQFTAESTRIVYQVLIFFSLRIVSEATLEIAARLFFAQHDTRTPMFVSLVWLVVNVGLAYWLVGVLGIGGMALASTLAFTLQAMALLYLNHRRLGGLPWRELGSSAGRILAATSGMIIVIIGIGRVVNGRLPLLIASVSVGTAAYLSLNLLLGGQEIPAFIRLLRSRQTAK